MNVIIFCKKLGGFCRQPEQGLGTLDQSYVFQWQLLPPGTDVSVAEICLLCVFAISVMAYVDDSIERDSVCSAEHVAVANITSKTANRCHPREFMHF